MPSIQLIPTRMSKFIGSLALVLLSLSWSCKLQATEEDIGNKIWATLEKAEVKLNQGMPKALAEDLWVQRVEIDRTNKLVRYVGLIKNRSVDKLSTMNIDRLRSRAKQNTVNHLCGKKASQNFLRLLAVAEGGVEYQFYVEQSKLGKVPLLSFKIDYRDCQLPKSTENHGKII